MMQKPDRHSPEKSVLLALLAIFIFASPFTLWWGRSEAGWYIPYLLWLVIIVLGAIVARLDRET